jgi:hypothetical protein
MKKYLNENGFELSMTTNQMKIVSNFVIPKDLTLCASSY